MENLDKEHLIEKIKDLELKVKEIDLKIEEVKKEMKMLWTLSCSRRCG